MAKRTRKRVSPAAAQNENLNALSGDLIEYHRLALEIMSEQGILPPLYGGAHLGLLREVVPLWDLNPELGAPTLSILLLRSIPELEPCADLRAIRAELEIVNDWPASELLRAMADSSRAKISGLEKLEGMMIFLIVGGDQVQPAAGYSREAMLAHISTMRPFAVFPIIPLVQDDGDPAHFWNTLSLTQIRAEVVYAETPLLLEAAVWDYRLQLAMKVAHPVPVNGSGWNGFIGNGKAIPPPSTVLELVGQYEANVLAARRLYGSTSPVRAQQEKLDILREDSGALIIPLPLKPEVEPIPILSEGRISTRGDEPGILIRLNADDPDLERIWPEVRAHRFYCVRARNGLLLREKSKIRVRGFAGQPVLDWFWADDLDELRRLVHLNALHELLALSGVIRIGSGQASHIYSSGGGTATT